ncbi:hypothetical protein V8C42DRAFT_315164 [Trichoderma barbatum]
MTLPNLRTIRVIDSLSVQTSKQDLSGEDTKTTAMDETKMSRYEETQTSAKQAIEEMGLPDDIFTEDHDWLSILFTMTSASQEIKARIKLFQQSIQEGDYPKSLVEITAFT